MGGKPVRPVVDGKRQCCRCLLWKSVSEFRENSRSATGFQYYCIDCGSKGDREYMSTPGAKAIDRVWRDNNPERLLFYSARRRSRKGLIPFTITLDDIVIPEVCPVLGIILEPGRGKKGAVPSSPSLDRIIPELGYVPGNVQVISHKANSMKMDATLKELRSFAAWVDTLEVE